MPVTRRQVLRQLGGDNTEAFQEEHLSQVPCTPARRQYTVEELEWAHNVPAPHEPDIDGDHQMVNNLTTHSRLYFGSDLN